MIRKELLQGRASTSDSMGKSHKPNDPYLSSFDHVLITTAFSPDPIFFFFLFWEWLQSCVIGKLGCGFPVLPIVLPKAHVLSGGGGSSNALKDASIAPDASRAGYTAQALPIETDLLKRHHFIVTLQPQKCGTCACCGGIECLSLKS